MTGSFVPLFAGGDRKTRANMLFMIKYAHLIIIKKNLSGGSIHK